LPALRGIASGAESAEAASNSQAVATALGTTCIVLAAVGGRKGRATVQRLASATGATSAKPFAGGLIGGESAFSSGDFNFDPLGLSVKAEKYLPYFREAELKHGRIAMLAWLGLVVPEFVRLPGPDACFKASVVDAHSACVGNPAFPFIVNIADFTGTTQQVGPLFQLFAFCGFVEMLTSFAKFTNISNKPGLTLANAGDYQLGVNFLPKDEAKVKEMKLKELKNGRLAMLAFGGAITQATLSGNGFPWLYASGNSKEAGLSSSLMRASGSLAGSACSLPHSGVARRAESGYKMSTAVPFLPMSPALEGYVGEEEGFDPMGVSLAIDIRWLRESELKHGRVAMLATVGYIATDLGLRVPGEAYKVNSLLAHDVLVKNGVMPHMLLWFFLAEALGYLAMTNMFEGKTDRQPGDFGLRGFYPKDAAGQRDMQKKELANGRLAMMAYGGIVTMSALTEAEVKWPFFDATMNAVSSSALCQRGSTLCGAKLARHDATTARRSSQRSQALPFLPVPKNTVGLPGSAEFDPVGLTDVFDVKYLQESEIKHGRVCMLATVGFAAEPFFEAPYFYPGQPNALDAATTAPVAAWAVLLFVAGFIESRVYDGKMTMLDMFAGERANRAPGDLNFGKGFLPKDADAAKEMQTKEIQNGRLAMLAIAGMIHHNIVVKGPLFPLIPDGWTGPYGVGQAVSYLQYTVPFASFF